MTSRFRVAGQLRLLAEVAEGNREITELPTSIEREQVRASGGASAGSQARLTAKSTLESQIRAGLVPYLFVFSDAMLSFITF